MMRVFVAGLGLSLCVGCFTADKTPKKSSLSSQPRAVLPAPSNIAEKGASRPSDFSVAPRNAGPASVSPVSLQPGSMQTTPGTLQLPNNPAIMAPQPAAASSMSPPVLPVGGLKDPKPPEPPAFSIRPGVNNDPPAVKPVMPENSTPATSPPVGGIVVPPVMPGG
ncbi:MAG: hypothetical protein ACRC8S_01860 [Fimbriiglobus sp.]